MLSLRIWLATLLGTFSVGIPLYIMFLSPGVSAHTFLTVYYTVLRVKTIYSYFPLRDMVIRNVFIKVTWHLFTITYH